MPPQLLRLNTPSPQSVLAWPMWFSSWCNQGRLNSFNWLCGCPLRLVLSLNYFPYYYHKFKLLQKSLVYAEQFIFQTLTWCLISMHLQYNSSRNREYRLILQFVIRGVEILCSNIHPRLKKLTKPPH